LAACSLPCSPAGITAPDAPACSLPREQQAPRRGKQECALAPADTCFGTPGVAPTDAATAAGLPGRRSTLARLTGWSAPPLARLTPAASRRAAVPAPWSGLSVLVRRGSAATLPRASSRMPAVLQRASAAGLSHCHGRRRRRPDARVIALAWMQAPEPAIRARARFCLVAHGAVMRLPLLRGLLEPKQQPATSPAAALTQPRLRKCRTASDSASALCHALGPRREEASAAERGGRLYSRRAGASDAAGASASSACVPVCGSRERCFAARRARALPSRGPRSVTSSLCRVSNK
jgi:hypothetical protein